MRSMTGYGKGIAERDERKVTVEIKTVNHRFLDLLFKLPRSFQSEEDAIRKILNTELKRGHVEIYLSYEDRRAEKDEIRIDVGLAKRYRDAADALLPLGVLNDLSASVVFRLPDVVSVTPKEDDAELRSELVRDAAQDALKSLIGMREREGAALKLDLLEKIGALRALLTEVAERIPAVQEEYRVKLETRVREALEGVELDEEKLLNEVAFFADRSNIDEETVRLRGHLDHFEEILNSDGLVGKQLDFLVQEMNREVNTTGSKAQDRKLTECVLKMKNVVEMLREQIQNLE